MVPVTLRALTQRINRKLATEGQKLLAARGETQKAEVGNHFIIDTEKNVVVAKNVDLEKLGKKLGVIKPFETLAEE